LLVAQAALAVAFSTGSDPLMTVACTWLWLFLVPLAGLANLRALSGSLAEGLTLLNLAMIPGSIAFLGLWLGGLALDARGLRFGMIPVGLAVGLALVAALSRIRVPRSPRLDIGTAWGTALLLIAAFPILVIAPLVVPAAATTRLVPGGTIATSPVGMVTIAGTWPAMTVSLLTAVVLVLAGWGLRGRLPLRPVGRRREFSVGPLLKLWPQLPPMSVPSWSRFLLWGAVAVAVFNVVTRP
jgi:hypothetical protein